MFCSSVVRLFPSFTCWTDQLRKSSTLKVMDCHGAQRVLPHLRLQQLCARKRRAVKEWNFYYKGLACGKSWEKYDPFSTVMLGNNFFGNPSTIFLAYSCAWSVTCSSNCLPQAFQDLLEPSYGWNTPSFQLLQLRNDNCASELISANPF